MKTSPLIGFGLYNLEIAADSALSSESELQPFSKIADLKSGNVSTITLATYEPDYWLLDGSYKFIQELEDAVHIGMMSLNSSDENGEFADPPVLEAVFSRPHSSDGLVLQFSQNTGDWASEVVVDYYDVDDNLITSDTYNPDKWEYEISKDVSGFSRMVVTFNGTNKPYRFLRLTGINYGTVIYFTESDIIESSVNEETNLIGAETIINSLDCTIYTDDEQFSILSPDGIYSKFAERQPLSAYEIVNNEQVLIGKYYLSGWKSETETTHALECLDAVSILDKVPYNGGMWPYEGIDAQHIIGEIMRVASVPYDLDARLYNTKVIGWLPVTTCREALQQVAFAIGAYVDCSRSNVVNIIKTPDFSGVVTSVIGSDVRSEKQSIELQREVTGVEITAHNYALGNEVEQLFTGNLEAGMHYVQFGEPASGVTITGGDILFGNVNYAFVRVPTTGEVKLEGKKYIDNTTVNKRYSTVERIFENVVSVDNATLVNAYNVETVTDRVYEYYQKRYLQEFSMFGATLKIGDVSRVIAMGNKHLKGVVESAKIDLSGGYVSRMRMRGAGE